MSLEQIVDAAAAKVSDAMRPDDRAFAKERSELERRVDRLVESASSNQIDDPWLMVASNDTISFSPTTSNGQPLLLNGKSTTFWPRADLVTVLQGFRNAIAEGQFDDQLTAGGQPTVSPKIEGEQTPADLENGSMSTGGGRTDTDETETRFTENLNNRLVE